MQGYGRRREGVGGIGMDQGRGANNGREEGNERKSKREKVRDRK